MKNAPVTDTHRALAGLNITNPGAVAQAFANIAAMASRKAWAEGYHQGRRDSNSSRYELNDIKTENPYPKLDP